MAELCELVPKEGQEKRCWEGPPAWPVGQGERGLCPRPRPGRPSWSTSPWGLRHPQPLHLLQGGAGLKTPPEWSSNGRRTELWWHPMSAERGDEMQGSSVRRVGGPGGAGDPEAQPRAARPPTLTGDAQGTSPRLFRLVQGTAQSGSGSVWEQSPSSDS